MGPKVDYPSTTPVARRRTPAPPGAGQWTAGDLARYRAEHREVLARVAAAAPPPPREALDLAAAAGCPTLRPTPAGPALKAAS